MPHFVQLRKIGVVVFENCSALLEQLHDFQRWRFAKVIDVLLVGHAKNQQLRPLETLLVLVESSSDRVHDVIGHRRVHFAGQLNKTRGEVELARLPRKIIRIDRNAVPPEARTGVERHEPKWLCGGGIDPLPNIYSHAQTEHLQFVDQRNVDATEDVLEQLGHFRGSRGANGHDAGYNLRVDRLRGAPARWIHAADDFWNLRQPKLFVAGIFALGRERKKEIAENILVLRTGGNGAVQTALFENGKNELLGGAGIRCRFKNHQLAPLQMGVDGNSGLFHVAEVWFAPLIQRCRHTDNDGVCFFDAREIRGRAKVSRVHELLDLRLRNVLDVGFAGIEHRHFFRSGVKSRHFVARLRETQG